jgi:hypothetical protein
VRPTRERVAGLGFALTAQLLDGPPAGQPSADLFPHPVADAEQDGRALGVILGRSHPAQQFDTPRDANLIAERAFEPEGFPRVRAHLREIVLKPSDEGEMLQPQGARPLLAVGLAERDALRHNPTARPVSPSMATIVPRWHNAHAVKVFTSPAAR